MYDLVLIWYGEGYVNYLVVATGKYGFFFLVV